MQVWNELTFNPSEEIIDTIWLNLTDFDYIVDKFSDITADGTRKVIKYDRPLTSTLVKKYPAMAIMDNTEIDYSENIEATRNNSEVFYIEIAEKGYSWANAKSKAKKVLINIMSMIDSMNWNGNDLVEKIEFLKVRNLNGFEDSPKNWIYTLTLVVRVVYTTDIYFLED